jgi:hypothetical protein
VLRFKRIPFAVSDVEVLTSLHEDLDEEKVHLAISQALSLWCTVAPLSFEVAQARDFDLATAGKQALLSIRFESDGLPNNDQVGATGAEVSNTPTGPIGTPSITIDADNVLFVDRYRERFPVVVSGGFDLIGAMAHEIGHALGLNHPPTDHPDGSIMTPLGWWEVSRQLYPYDIHEVQQRWGAIHLAGAVSADLPGTGRLIDASPGVQLQTAGPALVVSGPMGSRTLLDVLVPAKNSWVNSLHLEFTTVTKNVFVNRVEAWDGFVRLQQFAISARNSGGEGLSGRSWDLRLGFLARPQLTTEMLVRLELYFTNKDGDRSDFGVLQLGGVTAEILPPPIPFPI